MFSDYGLNKYRNFLCDPEVDDGSETRIILNTQEDVLNFVHEMLIDEECDKTALFSHGLGKMFIGVKRCNPDGSLCVEHMVCEGINMEFFQEMDGEMLFDCYGLIVEVEPGQWKIEEN